MTRGQTTPSVSPLPLFPFSVSDCDLLSLFFPPLSPSSSFLVEGDLKPGHECQVKELDFMLNVFSSTLGKYPPIFSSHHSELHILNAQELFVK